MLDIKIIRDFIYHVSRFVLISVFSKTSVMIKKVETFFIFRINAAAPVEAIYFDVSFGYLDVTN